MQTNRKGRGVPRSHHVWKLLFARTMLFSNWKLHIEKQTLALRGWQLSRAHSRDRDIVPKIASLPTLLASMNTDSAAATRVGWGGARPAPARKTTTGAPAFLLVGPGVVHGRQVADRG